MKPLKILYLDIIKPISKADGSLIHRIEVINNLSKLDVGINSICLSGAESLIDDKINCNFLYGNNTVLIYIQYFTILFRFLFFKKFDIIYTRNQNIVFLITILSLNRFNDKIVFELNGIAKDECNLINQNSKSLQKSVIAFLKEFIFKKSIKSS